MRKRQDPNAPATDTEEGFLSRWSRRKREAGAVEESAEALVPPSAEAPVVPPALEPAAPLTDQDLPPLETLGEDSDYSGFLSPKVSESLRRKALRQLFAGSQFHIRDGLDDYDDDYRNFESLGGLFTADMRHRMEMEARRVALSRSEQADAESPAEDNTQTEHSDTVAASEPAAVADDAGTRGPQSG